MLIMMVMITVMIIKMTLMAIMNDKNHNGFVIPIAIIMSKLMTKLVQVLISGASK